MNQNQPSFVVEYRRDVPKEQGRKSKNGVMWVDTRLVATIEGYTPQNSRLIYRLEENIVWDNQDLIIRPMSVHRGGLWRVIGENEWAIGGYGEYCHPKLPDTVSIGEFSRVLSLLRVAAPTEEIATLIIHTYFWHLEIEPSYEDPNWCGGWLQMALPNWHTSLVEHVASQRASTVKQVMDA
jgi:hypothetical protein